MVQPPGAPQAAQGALDALAEGGTRQVGALAVGIGEQRLGIGGARRRPPPAPSPPQPRPPPARPHRRDLPASYVGPACSQRGGQQHDGGSALPLPPALPSAAHAAAAGAASATTRANQLSLRIISVSPFRGVHSLRRER